MRWQEVHEFLRKQPFEPFTMRLSTGQAYAVRHPEFAILTKTGVAVGVPAAGSKVPDRLVYCDLLHVVAIEPGDGSQDLPRKRRRA